MHRKLTRCVLPGLIGIVACAAGAQPVYKCETQGAVVYSHEPCLGAQIVETTPTQGLDKWSGASRKGADVRRSEQNKAMADAMRPIFGETAEQRAKRHRRAKLPPQDQSECASLDTRLPAQETTLRKPDKGAIPKAEALFESRKRYRELRC